MITGPLLGLVRFHLVHNTGAAWGMFGDSTFLLGVMSLIVCVLLTVYLFFLAYRPNVVQVVGAALVVAGGLGIAPLRSLINNIHDERSEFGKSHHHIRFQKIPLRSCSATSSRCGSTAGISSCT